MLFKQVYRDDAEAAISPVNLDQRLRRAPAGHHPHRAVAAGSSPTCGPCRPPWTGTWSSATTVGPTRATEPGAARLPSCSGESRGGKIMIRRQTHEVYTPFRYWTPLVSWPVLWVRR